MIYNIEINSTHPVYWNLNLKRKHIYLEKKKSMLMRDIKRHEFIFICYY